MTSGIKEPKENYKSDSFEKRVQEAFGREIDKRRKLGPPILVLRNEKVVDLMNPQPEQTKTKVK